MICEHGTEKQYCRNGCSNRFCIHNVNKYQCKKCGGASICHHGKIRVQCSECHGSQVCEHNKRRSRCKDCKGGSICIHNKQKSICKECNGNSLCEHNIQKQQCRRCNGVSICIHDKIRSRCIQCTPDTKYYCVSCRLFGGVTKDNNYLCSYCNPDKIPRQKTREERVKQLLIENNLNFVHDKMITNDCCLKYRPDFVFDCGRYYLVLECDENGHSQYDKQCETIRMNNICLGLGLPTKFIRYNPDKKNVSIKKKEKILLETLNIELNRIELENIEPVYLFY